MADTKTYTLTLDSEEMFLTLTADEAEQISKLCDAIDDPDLALFDEPIAAENAAGTVVKILSRIERAYGYDRVQLAHALRSELHARVLQGMPSAVRR